MLTPVQTRFDAIVVGNGEVAEAVAAAGGRVLSSLIWAQLNGPVVMTGRPVFVVETIGVAAEVVTAGLERVAEIAAERELSVVVVLDGAQTDAVAAELLGERIHLVCDAGPAELVSALVLAAHEASPAAFGFVAETDGERLARVGDELARVVALLSDLVRREERARPDAVGDRPFAYAPPPTDPAAIDAAPVDSGEIRRVIRARRIRERAFGTRLFEDPAWDILLDLFAAHLEHAEVSVSSLCIAAAVAPTTALRWITRLTAAGLLVRERDPFDGRRALMSLSGIGLAAMRSYVAMLRAQGLPFV